MSDTTPIAIEAEPSVDQWRALYKAAQAYRNIAPWTFTSGKEYFGFVEASTGRTWYLSIRGAEEPPFGLIAFNGPASLDVIKHLDTGVQTESVEELLAYADRIPEHDYLIAAFGDRTEMRDRDLDVIESLKLKFHGARNWPQFRSVRKSSVDWFLTADEAIVLTAALEQALDVARRRRSQPDLLATSANGDILVRVNGEQGWADERRPIEPISSVETRPGAVPAAKAIGPAKKLDAGDTVAQVDIYWGGTISGEPVVERQHFIREFAAVDSASGEMLFLGVLPQTGYEDDVARCLVDACILNGARFAKLQIARPEVATILAPTAKALGIEIEQVETIDKLNEYRKVAGRNPISALAAA